jgi:hypothetical protein
VVGITDRRSEPTEATATSVGDATLDPLPPAIALYQVLCEGAGHTRRLQRVGQIHQLEVQVGSGRVTGVPNPADQLPAPDVLADGHRHGPGRQVREDRVGFGDPDALGHPVHGHHHLAVEGGVDGLTPAVVVARAPA